MKQLPAVTLFLITCCTAGAQSVTDSLLNLLHNHPQEDTVRFNLMNDLAFEYNFTDPDRGLEVSDDLIALASKLQNEKKLAAAYSQKGVNYASKGNDSMALNMYARALEIHTRINNLSGMAKAFNNIAIIYVGRADYANALEYYRKSYAIFEELDDEPRMANSLNNTGVVYLYLGDYPKALDYYLKGLSLMEKTGNDIGRANNLGNIGIVYKNLSSYAKAIDYQQQALALNKKAGNTRGMANTLSNIGIVYDLMNDAPKALNYYQQSLALNTQMGNERKIANDLTNIGVVNKRLGKYESAMADFKRALDIYTTSGDKNSASIALNQIGTLYAEAPDSVLAKMGAAQSSRYRKSLQYLDASLAIAKETGATDRLSETWQALSDTYAKQQDFKNAYHAFQQHIVFRDSTLNVENQKKIVRAEMQFAFEKKEMLADAEIKRERMMRNITIAGAILLLIAAAAIFIFYKIKSDANKKKKLAEFRAEVADIEMKGLRLQMNPHFIFNSLNSINDFISRNNTREADRFLTKFARLMRNTLEHSEQSEVSLADDLETLGLYMDLEALRLNNKFTYRIFVDESIDQENTMIPPLLLQPFVENSIAHGIAPKKTKGNIIVRITSGQNSLNCVVEDDGVGMPNSGEEQRRRHPGKSMGLRITKARIEMINKKHRANASVDIDSSGDGTLAKIVLPLQFNF